MSSPLSSAPRSRWRVLFALLAATVLALVGALSAPQSARADDDDTPSSWKITKYHVVATPEKDGGNTKVEIDLDFDFANDAGHGPFIVLPKRMGSPDPDLWRMLDMKVNSVSSGTGANANYKLEGDSSNLLIRIGKKGTKYTGVQNYKITYTIHGALFPNHPESKLDEFNWNAVGNAWQVPLEDVKVTLNSPAMPRKTDCYYGRKFATKCERQADPATSIVWTAERLNKGNGLQVVAGYPAGTFTNADFRTTKRYRVQNMFPITPVTAGGAGVVAAASIGGVVALARRRGRDQAWAGLAPGMAPLNPDGAATTARQKAPVAVAFRPPKGTRPGEIGTLIDEKADLHDVSATMVDLAVRGHMKIEETSPGQHVYHRTKGKDQLESYEANVINWLFGGGRRQITTEELKDKQFGKMMGSIQSDLYTRVTNEPLKWFRSNPQTSRALWLMAGIGLMVLGGGLAFIMGLAGYGLIPLGIALAGLVLAIISPTMPARTPAGSAVLAEAKGFELYLKTAEADQIKFEEGIDVFSRYLPYAMVFGVADRWAKIFEKLAAEGRYQGDTSWYVGSYGYGMGYGFASGLDSITHGMESAMQASAQAASSSSSGSGFGGGGGAGGGGGGGW